MKSSGWGLFMGQLKLDLTKLTLPWSRLYLILKIVVWFNSIKPDFNST